MENTNTTMDNVSVGEIRKKNGRNRLNLEQKLQIFDMAKNGTSFSEIGKIFGIDRSTVSKLMKTQDKLRNVAGSGVSLKSKALKKGKYQVLEHGLYSWFLTKRKQHAFIDNKSLRMKALQLHKIAISKGYTISSCNSDEEEDFNGFTEQEQPKFIASDGWVKKFKQRFGIRKLTVKGEKLSAPEEGIEEFKAELRKLISKDNVNVRLIYNADESALVYKNLPSKTLVGPEERSADGFKAQKSRITFMGCVNTTGEHKLPLCILGTAKQPRCFKPGEIQDLGISYFANKKAWMTRNTFKLWFHEHFIPNVVNYAELHKIEGKILLLLDNAPGHFKEIDSDLIDPAGRVLVRYLPKNTTSRIQPMDQHVIANVKYHYKESFMAFLLDDIYWDIESALKQITLKEVFRWLISAWSKVPQSLIQKSWKGLGINSSAPELEPDRPNLGHLAQSVWTKFFPGNTLDVSEMASWIDEDISPYEALSDDDIIEGIEEKAEESFENDISFEMDQTAEAPDDSNKEEVSAKLAVDGLNTAIKYLSEHNFNIRDINIVKDLKEKIFCYNLSK
jgi:hypothetical protein